MEQAIITILLSGITAATVTAVYNFFIIKRAFLREQLDKLYAPLYLEKSFLEEYESEYNRTITFSNELAATQKHSEAMESKLFDATFEKLNNYLINKDSKLSSIDKVIKENFSLIDIDDVEVFIAFLHYWEKVRIEIIEAKHKDYKLLKAKGLLDESPIKIFNKTLNDKFNQKKNILQYTFIGSKLLKCLYT